MNLLIVTQKVDQNDQNLGFFHAWIREFAAHFEKITVICLEQGQSELPPNVKVMSLGKEHKKSRLQYFMRFYKYIWQLRKNYDVVFVHMNPEYIVLGGLFWKMMGKPVTLWYTHKAVNFKLQVATLLANKIFTASKESFRIANKKVIVTGHGIDVDSYVPSDDKISTSNHDRSVFKIVSVGRISPSKGHEVIIAALKQLIDAGHEATLTVIGGPISEADRVYLKHLRDQVTAANLSLQVRFVGPVAPALVIPYLHESDVFVNTSNTGSLDKVVLEAMACALPVISSNDASKTILDTFGLAFESGSAEMLATLLLKVMKMPTKERHSLGMKLREIVVKHNSLKALISRLSDELTPEIL